MCAAYMILAGSDHVNQLFLNIISFKLDHKSVLEYTF
jgi:hypothetical protein